MLSIPSYKNDDPNYRYKMPRLVAKVEGRGNGIKTNIVNMGDIARALKRPPDYPTKFCGTELGAQSKFDPTEGKAIVNGAHEQRDLQVLIDKFIEKFVLCGNCKLPEIDLTVRKSRVQYRCNACGNKGDSDNTHKLSAFILKNPPTVSESTISSKKTKSSRREEKLFKIKSKGEDIIEEKKKKKEKQKDEKAKISKSKSDKIKEDTSTVSSEFSEDKIDQVEKKSNKKSEKKRIEVLHLNKLEPLNYLSPEISIIIEQLESFLTAGGKLNHIDENIAPESFCEQLRLIQISQGLDDALKFYLSLAALFAKQFGGLTSSSLKSRLKYLKPIAKAIKGANVLTGLQDFFYSYEKTPVIPEGFKAYAAVLYMFYDNDLAKADEIIKFFSIIDEKSEKCPNSQNAFSLALEASKPFLDWLNDSSEE